MKNKIIMITVLSLFMASCGKSKFEESMRHGKDAMQLGNYIEAVKQFETAVIENPSDKDAEILLSKSKEKLRLITLKERLTKYLSETKESLLQYIDTKSMKTAEIEADNDEKTKEKLDKLKDIKTKLEVIKIKYIDDKEIQSIHSILIESVDKSIESANITIELKKMVSDNLHNSVSFKINLTKMSELGKQSKELLENYVREVDKMRKLNDISDGSIK